MKKELAVTGPSNIEFNKSTGDFIILMKAGGNIDDLFHSETDPKFVELYVSRRQVDKIKYGPAADANERIQV